MGSNPMHVARGAEAVIDGANVVVTDVAVHLWVPEYEARRTLLTLADLGDGGKVGAYAGEEVQGKVAFRL